MITRTNLPQAYKPYQRLIVCSNVLSGGGHLVAVGEVLPLLVGSGEGPMVWLQGPTDQTAKNYVPLVAASVALHRAVTVVRNELGLTVSIGGATVLHVTQTSSDSAVIDLVDLRPIGLNIFGSAASLNAGGAVLSHNSFSGGGTLLAFGGPV